MSARNLDKEPRDKTRHTSPNPQRRGGAPFKPNAARPNVATPNAPRPNAPRANVHKHPDSWVTGSRPMTDAQAAYLKTLCERAGEAFYARLTKAEASKRIRTLRSRRW